MAFHAPDVRECQAVTIDNRSVNAVILPALERCLREIAIDRDCAADDLSFRVFRALETYGLECIRASQRVAAEDRASRSGVIDRFSVGIPPAKARKRSAAK